MAKSTLPTNFKDDILNASMGGKRRYNLINNSDGTVSLEDASTYDQVGSEYGASQVNAANTAVNASADAGKIVDDVDDIGAITEEGYIAGALALKSVNNSLTADNLQKFQFAYDSETEKYGYMVKEADTDVFVPFSSSDANIAWTNPIPNERMESSITVNFEFSKYNHIAVSLKGTYNSSNQTLNTQLFSTSTSSGVITPTAVGQAYSRIMTFDKTNNIIMISPYDTSAGNYGAYTIPVMIWGVNIDADFSSI